MTAPAPAPFSVRLADARPLRQDFPALTTKKLHLRSIIHEAAGSCRATRTSATRDETGSASPDEWADETAKSRPGSRFSPVAPLTTADGREIDQTYCADRGLKHNPIHRQVVSAWNLAMTTAWRCCPATPCSSSMSPTVLSCQYHQRSADIFLGVLFNIAPGALLTPMLAQVCDPCLAISSIPRVTHPTATILEQAKLCSYRGRRVRCRRCL